ncbi:MAG: glycoside hydrolase family 88 protein [Bacteroidota bacterium]
MRNLLYYLLLILTTPWLACQVPETVSEGTSTTYFENQLQAVSVKATEYLEELAVDSMAIPRSGKPDGTLHGTGSRDWTSGFYPGQLWQLYEVSQDERLRKAAEKWTGFIEKEKYDTHTHDLGFKIYCSFGQGYRLTEEERYKEVILQASKTLINRYNPKVGCIRSWDFNKETWQFPVIIDNMMNLEMLFEASRLSGDSTYYKIAYQHALTTLTHHIRADYSSYHVVDFDTLTGEVRHKHTHQGYSHESSWSRGQAWNIYGFAMTYQNTGDERFLRQAKAIADYIYSHPNLPENSIPYWDYNAPKIPNEPLDASAAAITASGLLILCELDSVYCGETLPWVDNTLKSLSACAFESNTAPFLLDHSVGSVPGDFEVDVPIIYADYYYVEALKRRIALSHKADSSSPTVLKASVN